ncbi:MAG: hypothetical protein KF909_11965 [Rhodocyclaceae bacterium]|nr:hypothetical protein [Rhodocyclaceae bacterium]MCB1913236.1 hypothetical protein [Rhodocyclaceae bacterium]MCP5240465.1 hypothetical protein [Zoogloeaceae bacterium]MCP5253426.1 hypothetical protein [Zoogloeaceae bacterium]MCW5617365.1 hypothetical protein [Rhodocyclaceae bacterium]
MPIMIEEMQAEVRPEREAPEAASAAPAADGAREAEAVEAVLREIALRDERRLRWLAD